MLALRHLSPTGKERSLDSFVAGLLGGYTVFARTIDNSVSQQIVIYVAARVCLAVAKLAVQGAGRGHGHGHGHHHKHHRGGHKKDVKGGGLPLLSDEVKRALARNGWPVFASFSWAAVMWIFRWHPEVVQSSLRSSMSYMWVSPFLLLAWRWRRRRRNGMQIKDTLLTGE